MTASALPPAERAFAEAFAAARQRLALSAQKVADAMVAAGFESFKYTRVYDIEALRRGIHLGEAVELARITELDLMEACGLRPAA